MFSYTATIGRNVSTDHPHPARAGEPLTVTEWEAFIEDVQAVFSFWERESMMGADSLEIHRGSGTWDGVEEESAMITFRTEVNLGDVALNSIRLELADLAKEYGQDAIAFTIGYSELISA